MAIISVQSPLASASRLTWSQRSTISSSSARGKAGIGSILQDRQGMGWAVLHSGFHLGPQRLVGRRLQDRQLALLRQFEHLGRFALADAVPLAQHFVQHDAHAHQEAPPSAGVRRWYFTVVGRDICTTIFEWSL